MWIATWVGMRMAIEDVSPRLWSVWAKSGSGDRWLPLVTHAADACHVAGLLYGRWLPESLRALVCGEKSWTEGRALVCWLAGLHDVGKVSPAFGCQVDSLAARMRESGLPIGAARSDMNRPPHSVVGHWAVERYLRARGWRAVAAPSVAVVVGGHHGVPPELVQAAASPRMVGGPEWDQVRDEFLEHVAEVSGVDQYLDEWADLGLTVPQQVVLTAVVVLADWLASDSERFPLDPLRDSESVVAQAFDDLELPAPWVAEPVKVVESLTQFGLPPGVEPNAVQEAAVEAAAALGGAGLMIVEAPMGSGKTEAALMAAQQLASDGGHGGLIVALPTQATSNLVFRRTLAWLQSQGVDAAVTLAHANADLVDEFRGLSSGAVVDVDRDSDCGCASGLIAHQWLSGRHKGLLANFVVGTIDQVLLGAVKSRYLVLRHLGLAGKVVVLDEVHAADDVMRAHLIRVLEWLGAYGVPVIALSATLPPAQRRQFVEAYARGAGAVLGGAELLERAAYPSVTTVSRGGEVTAFAPNLAAVPRRVGVMRIDDDLATLVTVLEDALAGGGRAVVIRNTVGRAQETARALRGAFPGDVVLAHSRFVAQHRADLEQSLLADLGPGDKPRAGRRIVVATQVVEQSLDIDFDVMVTDLAPVDLLLQRVGRLHRHERARPAAVAVPRLYIAGVQDWAAAVPEPVAASTRVYRRRDLLRALAVLDGRDSVSLPGDIAALVREAYAEDFAAPPGWEAALKEASGNAEREIRELATRAEDYQIRGPHARSTLMGWLTNYAAGEANVRAGTDSVEVIVTRRVDGGLYLLDVCGGQQIPAQSCPSDEVARRARSGAVRLPAALSAPWRRAAVIAELEGRTAAYSGWRESKWLRGELVLELDESHATDLAGVRLRYDTLDGLVMEACK